LSGKARRTIWQDGVEPEFWNQLRLIAMEYQTSTAKLITEIDR
jgi:predicted DNA-binding ribbon-helix-helix protein